MLRCMIGITRGAVVTLALIAMAGMTAQADSITVTIKPGTSLRNVNVKFFGNDQVFSAGTLEVKINNKDIFDAYCVDLFNTFAPGDSWQVDILPIAQLQGFGSNPPPLGRGGAVGWLFNTFAGVVSTNNKRAALQVAIWKMVYDGPTNLDFSSGNFIFTPASGQQLTIRNLADGYLSQFAVGDTGPGAWLRAVDHPNNRHQDLVTSVQAIPEPSALVMASGGIGD